MGLLNKKTTNMAPVSGEVGSVLSRLSPPYQLRDFLLLILNQIAEWIPADGYYAYAGDEEGGELTLKVTRAATGIATVGPNYAGLVLGAGVRTVPLTIPPLSDPWFIDKDGDQVWSIGFGHKVALRVATDSKLRLNEADREKIRRWLKSLNPLLDLITQLEMRGDAEPLPALKDVQRAQQNLLWQIPHLMGLLATLGSGVVKSTDGYLAVWDDTLSIETIWQTGLGPRLLERLSPEALYRAAAGHRFAAWDMNGMPETIQSLGFQSLLAVPINGQNGATGLLCFASPDPITRSSPLSDTIRYLAQSLENSLASRRFAETTAKNYLSSLFTATNLLDGADPYNKNHHEQVARLAARLAMKAGWNALRVERMEMAGRLHDVGMVTVALDLTLERGNLAEQTRALIQQHPGVGSDLLSGLPEPILPALVSRAIREHHERWDGLGYPEGLKGDEISEEGRILATAEQFVARISHRSYRQGLPVERALYDVQQLADRQLDPAVVDLLLRLYSDAGIHPEAPI